MLLRCLRRARRTTIKEPDDMTRRNYDSHVRARAALARKVAQHRISDGMNQVASAKTRWASGKFPTVEALLPAAFEAIAAFEWPEGWGTKYSRYKIFGKPMYVDGQTRDVPARIVRYIARVHMPALPQFTAAGLDEAGEPATPETPAEEDEYDFDKAVEEAREHLAQMVLEETDADDGLLATPAGDDTIDRRRRESLDAGYRVEEARIALDKALREQTLFGRGAVEAA